MSVKLCAAGTPTPLLAVIVRGNTPVAPSGGVPASVAVPFPLSVNVTPVGRVPEIIVKDGNGTPLVVTVKLPAAPGMNVTPSALVMTGACETKREPMAEEAAKPPCAGNDAASEWVPALKMPRLKVADPLERELETGVPPSRMRFTLPDGGPPGELTETVTSADVPKVTPGALRDVMVGATKMLSVTMAETLGAKLASPE